MENYVFANRLTQVTVFQEGYETRTSALKLNEDIKCVELFVFHCPVGKSVYVAITKLRRYRFNIIARIAAVKVDSCTLVRPIGYFQLYTHRFCPQRWFKRK